MAIHPLDIAAEQIVSWLIRHQQAGRHDLVVRATRSFLAEDIRPGPENGLGDVELEDITEITAVGELEVAPKPPIHGWILRVRVEDTLGERLTQDEPATEPDEEIDLEAFRESFIASGSGTAFVNVETGSPQAWRQFQSLLNNMRTDTH